MSDLLSPYIPSIYLFIAVVLASFLAGGTVQRSCRLLSPVKTAERCWRWGVWVAGFLGFVLATKHNLTTLFERSALAGFGVCAAVVPIGLEVERCGSPISGNQRLRSSAMGMTGKTTSAGKWRALR
jgi:hypothetical protein